MRKNLIDTGKYNKNQKEFSRLVQGWYKEYPDGVTLPPEYASFIHTNLNRFLIRLARYKFVARMIQSTDTLLEVGSGSGLGSIFLAQHCRRVTGIDIKTTEVEEAISINKRENVKFIVWDLFDLDLKLKYDVIVALDVIEHMDKNLGKKLVSVMSKHLKQNGMLVIGTPSIYSYPYQGKLSQASHVKCYDQKELVDLVGNYFKRSLTFSMNDEVVHTGNPKMAWYYFILGFYPRSF